MTWQIDRRRFLRCAAGPLLPLPFLNLMERTASGAAVEGPPVRFMTLFKPNGVHPPSWNINGGSEFDFRMSPLMKPFAKHKDDLLILDNMGDFGFSSHANSTRRFLCGHHQNTKSASIDQLIADRIGKGTVHRSLELTTEGLFPNQIGCSYISYDSNGDPIPRESDPQLIFDRLFRNPMRNPKKRAEMRSLLDRVSEDAKSLARNAGTEDRQTLDQYLSVVRETEQRIENIGSSAGDIPKATMERPLAPANLDEQVESMIDLITLALWTDSTRCVTYMLGNSNSRMIFDFLGISEQHHYLSHFFRNFSRQNLDALLKISLWHMEKFDYLLNRMKSFKDHQGTLLDHSVVLFGSGMGHSDNHTATRIPIILAGNGGGMLKTGRYVRYSENQQLGRLHLTLLQKFGVHEGSFGDSTKPLPGLNGSDFEPYQERAFESWVRQQADTITVQGRLRLSDDLNEARIFFVDVADGSSVRIEVGFRDFHDFNLAYHCGTPITLTGTGSGQAGQLLITKIQSLKSVFGKLPGTARG
ncbi:MAG: DUF1552 domain-containing protein [Rubripirellula sp.]